MIISTTMKMAILLMWTTGTMQPSSANPNSVQSHVVMGSQCADMKKAIEETGVHAKCVYFEQQVSQSVQSGILW